MLAISGNDRANRDDGDGDTPSNIKNRRRPSSPVAHSSPPPLAEIEVDQLQSQNNVTFLDFSVNSDSVEFDDLSHEAQSESSKRSRRVGANKDRGTSDGVLIAEQIQALACAMREGNQVLREQYAPQISGEDTFKLIQESGCDEDKVSKIYCSLMQDVSKLRAVIQCPPLRRKQVIMIMVFGG
ncbi:hypothetical protein QN277_003987 [Acacia crassicarpa]|uniref:Uncharacterized protein n=1 Tax=Acacia crassicarpa TaxID=499986 RepID=A0AAE1J206_9FABA|nr:hypothetical protein QN277_003987 [Acacia crassicarpa]